MKKRKKLVRAVEKEVVREIRQNDDGTETIIYGTEIVEEEISDNADPDAFGADRVWQDDGTAFANMDLTRRPKNASAKIPTIFSLPKRKASHYRRSLS